MELPRSLAPWSRYLTIFPRETSLAIGPLIQRISLAIGPMKSHSSSVAGDPDGFDNLARRGSYERLVTSEWLLADEAPEEFTRRAAMGEHVFLRIARREPSGSRVSLALFDAGPNQIGSPRIAHLAALIVLARRAEAARSNFGWGILQKPHMPVVTEVSESKVLLLMAARDSTETTDEDISIWRSRCDSWKELDDLWLVGGTRIASLPSAKGLPVLIVRDLIEPETRQLSVVARHVVREAKSVVLDLPGVRDSIRLIRDPFAVTLPSRKEVVGAFAPRSKLLFDASGAKLFARAFPGGVVSFPVPNSPRAGTGNPRVIRAAEGRWVSAVGRISRSTALLTRVDRITRVISVGRGSSRYTEMDYATVHRTIDYRTDRKSSEQLHPLLRIPTRLLDLVAIDDNQSLFRLGEIRSPKTPDKAGDKKMWLIGSRVLALAPTRYGVVFVGEEIPGRKWGIVFIGQQVARMALPCEGIPAQAYFGYGGAHAHPTFGFVAIQQRESQDWFLITRSGPLRFGTVDNRRVVGAIVNPIHNEPSLICLQEDDRTIVLVNSDLRVRPMLTASADIVDLTVNTAAPCIAYSTENGEVVVYSLAYRAELCRFQPREEQ